MSRLTDDELKDSRRVLDRILWATFNAPLIGKKADGVTPIYRDDQIASAIEIIDQLRGTDAKPTGD